jgi:hypothetical protein
MIVAPAPDASALRDVPRHAVARSGSTEAVLSYESGAGSIGPPSVRISRGGRRLFSERVPRYRQSYRVEPSLGTRGWFQVRDLDGDREPEVVLLVDWSGLQCCWWSRIYRFDRSRATFIADSYWWGGSRSIPSVRDVDGDGRPELVSSDDRFQQIATPYVGLLEPIRIWSYRHGRMYDVTQRHPRLVRNDAKGLWQLYLQSRGHRDVRHVLTAWAADEYVLGRAGAVDRALVRALRRGDLATRFESSGYPRDPRGYIRAMKKFLRRLGYIG